MLSPSAFSVSSCSASLLFFNVGRWGRKDVPGGYQHDALDIFKHSASAVQVPKISAAMDSESGAEPSDVIRGRASPAVILRPPEGSALFWTGDLVHAGAAVTTGQRLVFVASFTPLTESESHVIAET